MRKTLITAIALLICTAASAQSGRLTIQPTIGANLSSITSPETSYKFGYTGGLDFAYAFTEKFGLSAGIMYSLEGTKGDIDSWDRTYDFRWDVSYLNIPVLASLQVAKGFYLKTGVQVGIKGNSKVKLYDEWTSANEETKDTNISIPLGIAYQYHMLVFDIRYNWGLSKPVRKTDEKSSVFQLTVGYKIPLL